MVYERILKALQHILCKLLQLFHRQVEGLHQLVKLHLMYILAQNGVLASVAHNVHATQISHRREHGVRTVQQCHLTSVIRLLVVGNEHMQTGLLCWELLLHLFDGHVLSLLNHPEVEALSLHDKIVLVAYLLLYLLDGVAWEARHDAVYQRSANIAVLCKPLLEALIVGAEVVFP